MLGVAKARRRGGQAIPSSKIATGLGGFVFSDLDPQHRFRFCLWFPFQPTNMVSLKKQLTQIWPPECFRLSKRGIGILPSNVWLFDDRADNIHPFQGSGMNARQISCASRRARHVKTPHGSVGPLSQLNKETRDVRLCH